MDKYPVGLLARTQYFRVLKSVWNNECQKFVLDRMKASTGNLKPVIIVNDETKECTCVIPNENLTGFNKANDTHTKILCMKVHTIADYMIKKSRIQLSNKSISQKQKEIDKLIE